MKRFLWMVFILLSGSINAQYLIEGVVKDSLSGKPLPGAHVFMPSQNKGTVSDLEGRFRLTGKFDTLTLVVTMMGYKTYRKKLKLDTSAVFIPVLLQEKVFNLSEVLISTPFAKLQKDNVMKVSVRLSADLYKKGTANTLHALDEIPGVRLTIPSSPFSKPVIRGLSGNRVLMYSQNIRYENYQFGGKHGMDMSGEGTRSIEVIKGPASLLYGSDALGGIVYLVPEPFGPTGKTVGGIYIHEALNNHHFHGGGYIKSGNKNLKYLARFTFDNAGDYRIPGNAYVLNSGFRSLDFKSGMKFSRKKNYWELRYNYHSRKNGIYTGTGSVPSKQINTPYQDIQSHIVSLSTRISKHHSRWDIKTGYTRFDRALVKEINPFIGMKLHNFSFDVKKHFNRGNSHWIAGSQLYLKQNKNYGFQHLLPDAYIGSFALFGTVQREIKENWSLQAGVRGDVNRIITRAGKDHPQAVNKTLLSSSGSLGVKRNFQDKWFLRLNIAKGFRAPNLAELTSQGQHAARIELGNPSLKNESNYQIDFNAEGKSSHFEISTEFYTNYIKNYIYLQPAGRWENGLPVYAYTQDDALLWGNETALHFHPHPWDFLHIEASFETVRGRKISGEYLPLIPPDKYTLHVRFSVNRHQPANKPHWNLGVKNQFNDAYVRKALNEPSFPAYWLTTAYANVTFQKNTRKYFVFLNVQNLFDKFYIPPLSPYRDQKIPAPGRNINFGIRMHF